MPVKTTTKTTTKKNAASARASLPPGVKPSSRPISAALRKLLNEDRGIASGGRNIVHRPRTAAAR